MKEKFKKGDRVKVLNGCKIDCYTGCWTSDMNECINNVYTIKTHMTYSDGRIGYITEEVGWMFDERGLELVASHITIDVYGQKTVAKMYNGDKVVKTAVAKCNSDDEFVLETGAKLAIERLFEVKDEEIKVGDKVKVINTGKTYTTNVDWVLRHVSDKELIAKYAYDDDLGYNEGIRECDDTFIVRVIANGKAYIQKCIWYPQHCYLIDLEGLKKC